MLAFKRIVNNDTLYDFFIHGCHINSVIRYISQNKDNIYFDSYETILDLISKMDTDLNRALMIKILWKYELIDIKKYLACERFTNLDMHRTLFPMLFNRTINMHYAKFIIMRDIDELLRYYDIYQYSLSIHMLRLMCAMKYDGEIISKMIPFMKTTNDANIKSLVVKDLSEYYGNGFIHIDELYDDYIYNIDNHYKKSSRIDIVVIDPNSTITLKQIREYNMINTRQALFMLEFYGLFIKINSVKEFIDTLLLLNCIHQTDIGVNHNCESCLTMIVIMLNIYMPLLEQICKRSEIILYLRKRDIKLFKSIELLLQKYVII